MTWHEARRQEDGTVRREKRYASSRSDDRRLAQRMLRARLQAIGGRRPSVVDPEKVSYEDLRENLLGYCAARGSRSLKRNADGRPTLGTLPRLDRAFGGWRAGEVAIADLKRFRADGRREGLTDARLNRHLATLR